MMDEQLASIRENTTVKLLEDLKSSIADCTKNIKSNDALFEISTFPNVKARLDEIMSDYRKISRDVEASQKAFLKIFEKIDGKEGDEFINLNGVTEEFEKEFRKELKKISTEPEEEILMENQQVDKDPITRQPIKFAVRSNVCKHIYDKETIHDYFKQRKNKAVKCPKAGCTNKNMKLDELVDDEETNKIIQSL